MLSSARLLRKGADAQDKHGRASHGAQLQGTPRRIAPQSKRAPPGQPSHWAPNTTRSQHAQPCLPSASRPILASISSRPRPAPAPPDNTPLQRACVRAGGRGSAPAEGLGALEVALELLRVGPLGPHVRVLVVLRQLLELLLPRPPRPTTHPTRTHPASPRLPARGGLHCPASPTHTTTARYAPS